MIPEITSQEEWKEALMAQEKPAVLLFWAPWQQDASLAVVPMLAQTTADRVNFFKVQAEEVPDLSLEYGVSVVPTVLLFRKTPGNPQPVIVDRIEGLQDVSRLTTAVSALANSPATSTSTATNTAGSASTATTSNTEPVLSEEERLNARLKQIISSSQVMLFMKGVPTAPKCGFSRQAIELLESAGIPFGSFDILEDDAVRQGLKKYSDWPTYPQFYVKGELVGGLDIIKELAQEGDLATQLDIDTSTIKEVESLEDRIKKLIHQNRIMLFMKGIPSAPQCGFSRQIVQLLGNVPFDSFNILQDEEVRQGLKEFSDWPTYPQLYIDGELVGGLDIVKEMAENDELNDLLQG
jgi:Grx4 family monothiol glutaredoxin